MGVGGYVLWVRWGEREESWWTYLRGQSTESSWLWGTGTLSCMTQLTQLRLKPKLEAAAEAEIEALVA